jgi:hypothetical protein
MQGQSIKIRKVGFSPRRSWANLAVVLESKDIILLCYLYVDNFILKRYQLCMRRTPLGGLFLAACVGVEIAEICPTPLLYWAIGFGLLAIAAVAWKRTALALAAALLFFAFWHSFRKTSDQGYKLRSQPGLASRTHKIDFEADADSKPFHWGNQIKQRLIARVTAVDGYRWNFRVQAELSGQPIHYGDSCQVTGRLAIPQSALNPGEFDERTYLEHQGIYLILDSANSRDVTIIRHGWGNPILAMALRCRKAVQDIPLRSLENDRPIKALIEGVTFGDRSEFDADLLDLLQDTCTLHLFVIDGLKVTLLAGISWIAARFFCLPRRWIAGVVVPLRPLLRRHRFVGSRLTRHADGFVRPDRGITGTTGFTVKRHVRSGSDTPALQSTRVIPARVSIVLHHCRLHRDRGSAFNFVAASSL